MPPSSASVATCQKGGAIPHRKSAGIVKIVPDASEELAEPIVCEMFASRRTFPPRGAQRAEQRDGEHGDGDRGRDREADAQAEVGVRGAEDDAEDDASDGRAQRELDHVVGRSARHGRRG